MNKKIKTIIDLFPASTAECDLGPKTEFVPGFLKLSYDYESEEGLIWSTLEFDGAIASRFTPDICVKELMISAYSKVCEILDSEWIEELSSEAESHDMTFPPDRRHFMIYFDHKGCFEVLAWDVKKLD